jgi:hypothetical protein
MVILLAKSKLQKLSAIISEIMAGPKDLKHIEAKATSNNSRSPCKRTSTNTLNVPKQPAAACRSMSVHPQDGIDKITKTVSPSVRWNDWSSPRTSNLLYTPFLLV